MLVLSRRPEEKVLIEAGGIEIWITVVRFDGWHVVLGFEAPREVKIMREELR